MSIALNISLGANTSHGTMLSEAVQDPVSKPTGLKRSLFNKPSWSKPQATTENVDIFRRSEQTYTDILAEEEKKRARKLAKKEKERAKQVADGAGREEKRRRISDYSKDNNGRGRGSDSDEGDRSRRTAKKSVSIPPESSDRKPTPAIADRESSPKSLSKRYEASITTAEFAQERVLPVSNIIDLEDEDTQCTSVAQEVDLESPQEISQKPIEDDDFPFSDEEFPELARKAREKAKLKRMREKAPPPTELHSSTTSDQKPADRNMQQLKRTPTPPPPDPPVQILITSKIPNTNPLIVNRRLTQRLKDVRITWCLKQGFTEEATATVFLTWRGKRLFDVTTCKSLGIGVDADGNVAMKGEKDVLGEENRQIHMEAMTNEIMESYKKARNGPTPEEAEQRDEEVDEPPKQPKGTKIILRSKGYDDFKLIVNSVRTISFSPNTSCTNLEHSQHSSPKLSTHSEQPKA